MAAFLLFAACLFPGDINTVTAVIGYNAHPVAFYIGPALYLLGDGLVPGIDFMPQYGIGIGAFFSLFLRPTAQATVANTVWVTAGLSLFYFATAFLFLRRLYGSQGWSLAVVLFALILNFHTQGMGNFMVYGDPSAWPVRYPFLFVFCWLFAKAADQRGLRALLLAGAASGLCLFWNTETGFYTLVSGAAGTVLLGGRFRRAIGLCSAFVGSALAAFVLLAFTVYGPGVFQVGFVKGLFDAFRPYAAGLGAWPVGWDLPLTLVYGVTSQIGAFASMGMAAAVCLRGEAGADRRTGVSLFLLSMLGACLLLKWVNMSIDALWHVNALPVVAVFGWWALAAFRRLELIGPVFWSRMAQTGAVMAMVLFLWFVQDSRNPSLYGLQAFRIFPSVLLRSVVDMPRHPWPAGLEPSDKDIALIKRFSAGHEPVAIFSIHDWVFLLAAERPPKLPWLPSPTTFFMNDVALRGTGPIFVGDGELEMEMVCSGRCLRDDLRAHLAAWYQPGPKGGRLQVYLRK